MPRKSRIKWRESDRVKLTKVVRSFNAKLTRTAKKHPELKDFLPDRVTTESIKNQITTRADFNRQINSLQRFLRKGAEAPVQTGKGIKTTRWEIKEIGYKVGQINRKRTMERKRANVSTFTGTMGTIQQNSLIPKKYNINSIAPRDWKKFVEGVEKQIKSDYFAEKNELYKQNYIKGIRNVMPRGIVDEIEIIVSTIPPDSFIDLFYKDPILNIEFIYDPLEASFIGEQIVNHLHSAGY